MDFLLLLTIIGFIISIYQISEESKRRNLIFKFSFVDKVLLTTFALVIVFAIFSINFWSQQVSQTVFNFSFLGGVTDNCTAELTGCYEITFSFLYSIFAFVLSAFIIWYFIVKLNSNNLKQKTKFMENILDKLGRQQYSDVSADLELFHTDLLKSYKTPKMNRISQFLKWFGFNRNRTETYCKLIDDFYYELTGNNSFLEYVAMNNTDLMFMLLDNEVSYRKDDVWFVIGTKLISDKTSKLYKELDDSIKGRTKILDFLFNDTTKCQQWLVWKPIGDYVIKHLREQERKDIDEYNFYEEYYEERTKNSTLYSGIKFFEIMVENALKQNTKYHMWLMYFDPWLEQILQNINYENYKDVEYCNMYEYYLYLIIGRLYHWISYSINHRSTPENNLIIENAIKSMVNSMEKISSSNKLRDEFKSYLREIMINNYFELLGKQDQIQISLLIKKYNEHIENKIDMYEEINVNFIDFLKYPVEHYNDRKVWDKGAHYSAELRGSFIQFLDSLSQESIYNVQ